MATPNRIPLRMHDSACSQEIALRAGREAARSAEEWGLPRHRAWEAGVLVALRALGEEAAALGKPLDTIFPETFEVAEFIGNAASGQESLKQAARGLGRHVFELELEAGKPVSEAAAHAARFSAKAAQTGRLSRQRALRLACRVAAAAMRTAKQGGSDEAALAVQAATFSAGQDAGFDEALELSCMEGGAAAGQMSLLSGATASSAAREAAASAVRLGAEKGLPSSKAGRAAAKAASRCASEAPGSWTETGGFGIHRPQRRGRAFSLHRFSVKHETFYGSLFSRNMIRFCLQHVAHLEYHIKWRDKEAGCRGIPYPSPTHRPAL